MANHATSAAYTNDGSAGAVGGLSTVATPVEFDKSGYVGQLYDVTSLSATASSNPATVNGGATLQLAAWQVLDDSSLLPVPATAVAWSVITGPIASALLPRVWRLAAPVYQNTSATVQGMFGGFTGALEHHRRPT